jgi:hypothetical protein
MKDFKLKLVLATLTGIVFSFIFILLAFVLPSKDSSYSDTTGGIKPKGKLEQVSQSIRNR